MKDTSNSISKHRQLGRVKRALDKDIDANVKEFLNQVQQNALDQLEEAFIFHYHEACKTFKSFILKLSTLRCPSCGQRHIRALEKFSPQYYFYCGYGYFSGFSILRATWFAGIHGED